MRDVTDQTVEVNQEVTMNQHFSKNKPRMILFSLFVLFMFWLILIGKEKKLKVTSSKCQLKAFKRLNTFFFRDTSKNLTYLLQTRSQTLLLST